MSATTENRDTRNWTRNLYRMIAAKLEESGCTHRKGAPEGAWNSPCRTWQARCGSSSRLPARGAQGCACSGSGHRRERAGPQTGEDAYDRRLWGTRTPGGRRARRPLGSRSVATRPQGPKTNKNERIRVRRWSPNRRGASSPPSIDCGFSRRRTDAELLCRSCRRQTGIDEFLCGGNRVGVERRTAQGSPAFSRRGCEQDSCRNAL